MINISSTQSARGRNAVRAILFPSNDEKQCVLLKRGPILLNRKKEQELFLFTTGILLINMDLEKLLDNSLAALKITGTDNSFSPEKLKRRFEDLDKDGSGALDIEEVHELFHDLGLPITQKTLEEVIKTIDANSDGQITFEEFEQAFRHHEINDSWVQDKSDNKDNNIWGMFSGSLAKEVKPKKKLPKLGNAYALEDVESVEGADAFCHESNFFASEQEAENSFGIYVSNKNKPILATCIDADECDEWLDIFQTCFDNTRRAKESQISGKSVPVQTKSDPYGWKDCDTIDWGDE
mmetsp:Transcript_10528/g.21715  ORF Transcript_10528/g.21715 Transcript_10528/m.21715 type:complete len:294 (+) Transcript_10528:38-919(+)